MTTCIGTACSNRIGLWRCRAQVSRQWSGCLKWMKRLSSNDDTSGAFKWSNGSSLLFKKREKWGETRQTTSLKTSSVNIFYIISDRLPGTRNIDGKWGMCYWTAVVLATSWCTVCGTHARSVPKRSTNRLLAISARVPPFQTHYGRCHIHLRFARPNSKSRRLSTKRS